MGERRGEGSESAGLSEKARKLISARPAQSRRDRTQCCAYFASNPGLSSWVIFSRPERDSSNLPSAAPNKFFVNAEISDKKSPRSCNLPILDPFGRICEVRATLACPETMT